MTSSSSRGKFSRRALLGGAAVGTAGVGVGAVAGWAAAKDEGEASESAAEPGFAPVSGWFGPHQPGIADRGRANTALASFTCVAADRKGLEEMFKALGAEAHRLCDGLSEGPLDLDSPPPTTGIMGDESTKGTAVTVSVGASLFDGRYGLADRKPVELVKMPFLVNDRLVPEWSHGDVLVQVAADRPDAIVHALRQLMRATRDSLVLHWTMSGFNHIETTDKIGQASNRNTLGFKDGTANLDMAGPEANEFVWMTDDRNGGVEPEWTVGGTYAVTRLIRTLVEQWDRATLGEQQDIIGREKESGAPLGLTGEATDPDYPADPHGKRIPLDAHIRLARPRTPPTEKKRMLRKGFNYSQGFDANGLINEGLAFVSYQQTLDAFMTIQMRLKGEPLEEYTLPFGGGFFYTLPGVQDEKDWLGRTLLA